MKYLLKKTVILFIALCVVITSTVCNTSTVSAAAYKSTISKKMKVNPGGSATLSFKVKKDTTVTMTIKATDGKSKDYFARSTECVTCMDDLFANGNEEGLAGTDSRNAGKIKQQLTNSSGSRKIKLKKGNHNISIATNDDVTTQKVKITIKAVNGKELLKIGEIEYFNN